MSLDQTQIVLIAIGVVAFLIVALLVLRSLTRKTTVIDRTEGDVLDEGAARAARNQALIDAPHAAETSEMPPPTVTPAPLPEPEPEPELVPAAAPAPAPKPEAETAPEPEPTPEPAPASADDLTRIKGLGPKIAGLLAGQGVTRFAQIAAWTDADVERIDANLGRFQGRITRDQWVEQAKLLSAGDEAGFAQTFGQNR